MIPPPPWLAASVHLSQRIGHRYMSILALMRPHMVRTWAPRSSPTEWATTHRRLQDDATDFPTACRLGVGGPSGRRFKPWGMRERSKTPNAGRFGPAMRRPRLGRRPGRRQGVAMHPMGSEQKRVYRAVRRRVLTPPASKDPVCGLILLDWNLRHTGGLQVHVGDRIMAVSGKRRGLPADDRAHRLGRHDGVSLRPRLGLYNSLALVAV